MKDYRHQWLLAKKFAKINLVTLKYKRYYINYF